MTSSLRVLLARSIDYAGLFPPAALDLPEAVRRYAAYRAGPHAWMLGRLIIAASHMSGLEAALAEVSRHEVDRDLWHVSVIAAPPFAETLGRIWDFNGRHGDCGAREAVIDAIEVKARTLDEVGSAADAVPAGFDLFVETPLVNMPPGLLEAVARSGAAAKLRTGGTTADQIPTALGLATTLAACHRAGAPFKATAGLHHAIRSERPLTYDAVTPMGVVHGFLNVLLAAAAIDAEWVGETGAAEILTETSPEAFRFADDSVAWRGHLLTLSDLRAARRFFRCFGSCSFDEPVEDLGDLALL